MAQDDVLRLEHEWVGSKLKMTARLDGKPVHLDSLDPASATARRRFIKALQVKVPTADAGEIDGELLRIADTRKETLTETGGTDAEVDRVERLAAMPADIKAEAEAMLMDRSLIQRVVDDVAALNVAGEKELTLTVYLIGVSRLQGRPLAGIVQGPSSSGKSHVIEQTTSLFPAEAVILATQMTPQSLFHMKPGTLRHRFVVGGERSRLEDDDRAEATRALREMLSAGKLTKLMPMKIEGGPIETVQITQDGPIAFVESTTMSKIFVEDANRCLMLHTDEGTDQTRRIVKQLAADYAQPNCAEASNRIILRHHALQRMLNKLPVVVPYAVQLGELIPSDRVETRRAFPQLIGMVRAITLLHQRQRNRDAGGALVATEDDYQLARHLLLNPMTRLLGGGPSKPAQHFHRRLSEWVNGPFSTTEAKRKERSCESAVAGWIVELHDAGLIELITPGRGNIPAIWRLSDSGHWSDHWSLPAVELLFPKSTWKHGGKPQFA